MTMSVSTPTSCPSFVQEYLQSAVGPDCLVWNVQEAKSAQQQVLIITCNVSPEGQAKDGTSSSSSGDSHAVPPLEWRKALCQGGNRLVVRIWKGSSRWWNLHRNEADGVLVLARAEVAGYRIARQALIPNTTVEIPKVLYFSRSHLTNNVGPQGTTTLPPWAIMTYVGAECDSLVSRQRFLSQEWLKSMIPVRPEYGFDEPHPRWGRVPVDRCLDYVFPILVTVVLPIQRYCMSKQECPLDIADLGHVDHSTGNIRGRTFMDMIDVYQAAHGQMASELLHDASNCEGREGSTDSCGSSSAARNAESWTKILSVLGTCIHELRKQGERITGSVPPVLCHMDCQPQNLLFFRDAQQGGIPQVSSVLDWEEAAYADPRFEILLICRKVCANRDQADKVWEYYSDEMKKNGICIGPLEPWLKLETVHSITTLLLQTMDLLGGGRSPWETKPDLWGKTEREFHRLIGLGWTFCELALNGDRSITSAAL